MRAEGFRFRRAVVVDLEEEGHWLLVETSAN